MSVTKARTISRVLCTSSPHNRVYGLADDGRVFSADERDTPGERRWSAVGFLATRVRLGHPLIVVVDDMVTVTSPVIVEQKLPTPLDIS